MNKNKTTKTKSESLELLNAELMKSPTLNPLVKNLVERSLAGNFYYKTNLHHSIHEAIQQIDQLITKQIRNILHQEQFRELEGRWRGLHKLVKNSKAGSNLKIKMMNCNLNELQTDFSNSVHFEQSQIYKKIYELEFGTPGGQTYAALVADYEFDHEATNLMVLQKLAQIGSVAFCPIISAPAPSLLGLNSWQELNKPRELNQTFESPEYFAWNRFREADEARFVYLCLPRSIARPVYSTSTKAQHSFTFNEFLTTDEARDPENYCWMNSAYQLATLMCHAYIKYGWCINIRGTESGGRVEELSLYPFKNDAGEYEYQCPTEVNITDRREAELSKLGFLPLCYYKNTDYAVFFGAESLQKSINYDKPEAAENARISARLPYVMATSRFAHYLKIIARDKIGSFMSPNELNDYLNRWILNYVNANKDSKQALKAKYPLAEARIEVRATPGKSGAFEAVAWLRPWLQMEELTASLRLVARIPEEHP